MKDFECRNILQTDAKKVTRKYKSLKTIFAKIVKLFLFCFNEMFVCSKNKNMERTKITLKT